MNELVINELGLKGLNTDLAPYELPADYITFGVNFRVSGNELTTVAASYIWASPPAPFNAGHVMSVESYGSFWIVPGRAAVWIYDGAGWFDISNPAGYAGLQPDDELKWTSCMLGSIPLINNYQSYPEYWSPQSTSQAMTSLNFSPGVTWLQANKSFKVIRSYKNFLFALNLVEGGVEQPNSYRWSHPADINGLPYTWDENDTASIASIEQILGDSGPIIDGLTLRDSFCIYSERAVTVLDQGGEFVFRARELSSTYGLISQNCIVEVKGAHYFLSDGDILRNDGNSIHSIIYDRIQARFNSQVNTSFYHRSFVVLNKALKEIWFCVPENASEYPDTAYIYNWIKESWTIKDLPPNVAFAAYGTITETPTTWATSTETWASTNATWGTESTTPLNRTVISVDASTSDLVVINPLAQTNGTPISARIERTDFPLAGHNNVTTLTRIYPHMRGTANLEIQVGSQEHAGAPVAWKPVQTFNPSTDRKIDVRTTGELHAWRFQSVGTGHWSLSGLTIEFTSAGKR